MARHRGDGASHTYPEDDYYPVPPDSERRHRRRHRHRDHDHDPQDDYPPQRDRHDRHDRRRETEADLDALRAREASYYADSDLYRDRDRDRERERMAQPSRPESTKSKPRSSRELHRDGTRRKKKRDPVPVPGRGSDEYVYTRSQPRPVVEEVAVRTSSGRKRSDEGASSSRTAYTPLSGSGTASVRRLESANLSRSASAREPGRSYMATRPVRRTSTTKLSSPAHPTVTRSFSAREPPRRNTGGLLSSFFRPSARTPPVAVPRVDCLICMNDDLPLHKTAKLACGHRMCHSCLKRQFTLSVQDPQHMPPRCCTQDHIPLKYAERLFDDKFKSLWNKKYQEYTTENRLYCPARSCGEWIKPSKIRVDLATKRKYARCSQCDTKVCVLCNSKFHSRRECPKDEETNRLVQMAKEKGWQRCYSCKAVVELKEGCNHMTCRCTAQFCMVCALPWKTCSCPWFNYEHIEDADRPSDMRVPYTSQHPHPNVEVIEVTEEPSPMVRRSSTRTRHRSGRDRERERTDSALAAHLQSQLRLEPITPTTSEMLRAEQAAQVYGLGNAGGHHMNDSYTVRPLNTSAAHTPVRVPAPRQSYFSGRRVVREVSAPIPAPPAAPASAMAGLSSDGTKRGANRVGTWLNHVQVDPEAINTQARDVEVDDWRCDGTMIGID